MNVTDLIKHTEVRKFLLDNFPKPIFDRKEIFAATSIEGNKNPSLTGNTFEIFLRLLSLKSKLNFKREFEYELGYAQNNITRALNYKREPQTFKDHLKIYLSNEEYDSKIRIVIKILRKGSISFTEKTEKFLYTSIDNINDISISSRILKNTQLHLADILHAISFSIIWPNPPSTILLNRDSLVRFLEDVIKKFEEQSHAFIKTRKLNSSLIISILEFTQISSQFFVQTDVVKGLHFEESYINYVFDLFNIVYQRKDIHKKSLLHHPTLKCSGILATPDFFIENKILEIKTSKVFYSTKDYLQALVYLLLAQDSQNKKRWGSIKQIELFYPVFNKSVKLKLEENNQKIKPTLKFLKDFSTNEPKEKLRKLKRGLKNQGLK